MYLVGIAKVDIALGTFLPTKKKKKTFFGQLNKN